MKLKEIKGSDTNFGEVIKMLIDHFNYSINEINSYDELTESEKEFISKELFDKITEK